MASGGLSIRDTGQGWRTWILFIFFGNSPESLTWDDATIRHKLCEKWDEAEASDARLTTVAEGEATGSATDPSSTPSTRKAG